MLERAVRPPVHEQARAVPLGGELLRDELGGKVVVELVGAHVPKGCRYLLAMPVRISEARLVKRAARGDRDAFDELVTRHRDRVWAIALRMCRDRDDAEDVLQETFLAAWRSLDRFGGRSEVSTWLYRIAINKSHDVIARRRTSTPLDELPEQASPVDAGEQHARRQAIERALQALTPEFRAVAVLCDILGLTPAEAAEVLEIPEGTAKSRVFRARAELARALAPDWRPTTAGGERE